MSQDRLQALILSAGSGPGLRPAGDALRRVAGRTLLEIWSSVLRKAGIDQARWVSSSAGMEYDRDPRVATSGIVRGLSPSIPGTAAAIAANADLANGADHILIVRSNALTDLDPKALVESHLGNGRDLTEARARDGGARLGACALKANAYREVAASGAVELDEVHDRFSAEGRSFAWRWSGDFIDLDAQGGTEEARRRGGAILAEILRPQRPGGRRAVFLDRDGTINVDIHYLCDPNDLRLIPGAAGAIRGLRAAGFPCVVVTNQSGIGRGLYTHEQLDRVHDAMRRQLAEAGTAVDAIYACAEAPSSSDPTWIEHLDRKPGPGMLYRAAEDLGLDVEASWMIGDTMADWGAGRNAGCRGVVLVRTGRAPAALDRIGPHARVVDDLAQAAALILSESVDEPRGPNG